MDNSKIKKAADILYNSRIKLQRLKELPQDCKPLSTDDAYAIQKMLIYNNLYFYELYNKAYTPWKWIAELAKLCNSLNQEWFASPFDETAVDFLEKLKCKAYKLASPEITDIGLIEKISKTKKPIIISTGLAEKKDIDLALAAVKKSKWKPAKRGKEKVGNYVTHTFNITLDKYEGLDYWLRFGMMKDVANTTGWTSILVSNIVSVLMVVCLFIKENYYSQSR